MRSLVPWWGQNDYNTDLNAACSLAWDPHATSPTLWATDFFGVYVAVASPDNASEPLSFVTVSYRATWSQSLSLLSHATSADRAGSLFLRGRLRQATKRCA